MFTPREMRAGVPQGSVLSPTWYSMYINDAPPPNKTWCLPSLPATLVCTRQIERRVLLSENSSVASAQWRPGVSAEILK
jgi:hypothetical protein